MAVLESQPAAGQAYSTISKRPCNALKATTETTSQLSSSATRREDISDFGWRPETRIWPRSSPWRRSHVFEPLGTSGSEMELWQSSLEALPTISPNALFFASP